MVDNNHWLLTQLIRVGCQETVESLASIFERHLFRV